VNGRKRRNSATFSFAESRKPGESLAAASIAGNGEAPRQVLLRQLTGSSLPRRHLFLSGADADPSSSRAICDVITRRDYESNLNKLEHRQGERKEAIRVSVGQRFPDFFLQTIKGGLLCFARNDGVYDSICSAIAPNRSLETLASATVVVQVWDVHSGPIAPTGE
jgi:hypothetical protein